MYCSTVNTTKIRLSVPFRHLSEKNGVAIWKLLISMTKTLINSTKEEFHSLDDLILVKFSSLLTVMKLLTFWFVFCDNLLILKFPSLFEANDQLRKSNLKKEISALRSVHKVIFNQVGSILYFYMIVRSLATEDAVSFSTSCTCNDTKKKLKSNSQFNIFIVLENSSLTHIFVICWCMCYIGTVYKIYILKVIVCDNFFNFGLE